MDAVFTAVAIAVCGYLLGRIHGERYVHNRWMELWNDYRALRDRQMRKHREAKCSVCDKNVT